MFNIDGNWKLSALKRGGGTRVCGHSVFWGTVEKVYFTKCVVPTRAKHIRKFLENYLNPN